MFEVWTCKEQPSVQLVVPAGGSIPAELGQSDWQLVGPFQASADVAASVAEKGYHFVTIGGEAGRPAKGNQVSHPANRQSDYR